MTEFRVDQLCCVFVFVIDFIDPSLLSTPPRPSILPMASDIKYEEGEPPHRPVVAYSSLPELSSKFMIDAAQRSYKHQYSNIYFVRLVELRPKVEERAAKRWANVRGE
jgi:hypothetical protein